MTDPVILERARKIMDAHAEYIGRYQAAFGRETVETMLVEALGVQSDNHATILACIDVLRGSFGAGRGGEALLQRNDDIAALEMLLDERPSRGRTSTSFVRKGGPVDREGRPSRRAASFPAQGGALLAPDAPECATWCADPPWCVDAKACWRTNEWRDGAIKPRITAVPTPERNECLSSEPSVREAERTLGRIIDDAASDLERHRQPQVPGPRARADGRSMMSGPYGGVEPPAILIVWSSSAGAWRATAVVAAELEPIEVEGPTSSHGSSPSAALDELLGRRFGILFDEQCAPTLIEVRQVDEPR